MMKHLCTLAILALASASTARADVTSDLQQAAQAFKAQTAVHADENFSNGDIISVDLIPPDRVRVAQPKRDNTTIIIGSDFWNINKGHVTKLPSFAAKMATSQIDRYRNLYPTEFDPGSKDLGMQKVGNRMLHAYSAVSHGIPTTIWLDAKHLPQQVVTTSGGITTTITYS